ncbi:ABC transporter permease [Nocardioides sp.]|uniref:ABC transporter permease n=1 Tax=Nocardioides sp. TaxID=35761 RepID=UPI002637F919|nr:ABC transporter permease [Nocardioides sp.]MDI6910937.1 ABC transporter permease [Nocardioides sp.]
MTKFIAKRVFASAVVMLTITVLTFLMARVVPSNPAVIYAGPKASPETLDRIQSELGLDKPLLVQFFDYLGGLLHGDFGDSLATKQSVLPDLLERLPATLELIATAMTIATVLGVALGVLAARRRSGALDGSIRFLCIGGISMPAFWLGLILQVIFVGKLGVLPATGQFSTEITYSNPLETITHFALLDCVLTGNWVALQDGLEHLVLPAVTLAAYPLGLIARMTRASMLESLDQDYALTARAYGLSPRSIVWRLTLKNALSAPLTIIGLSVAYMLTGTFFVEVVFNWPGLGQYATQAMLAVDYPVIMAITLLGAAGYLLTNFAVDLLQAKLDPRTRS